MIDFGNSDELQVGDVVLAIGNPFGVGQTVTHGIVSAVARTQVGISDYQFFIQTDAAINPGNSGGALVDMAGRLVGINTAIFSRSGGSQGIGFAIPANMVRVVVASARAGGSAVKRPWLGAKLQALTPELSQAFDLQAAGRRGHHQRHRAKARRRGPGCKPGDVIVSVDGQPVDDPNAFDYRFTTHPLGGKVELGVVRGGKESKRRGRARNRAGNAARRNRDRGALAVHAAPRSPTCRRRWPTSCGSTPRPRAWPSSTSPTARWRSSSASSAATSCSRSTARKIAKTRDLERVAKAGARLWRITIQRGGQQISAVFGG